MFKLKFRYIVAVIFVAGFVIGIKYPEDVESIITCFSNLNSLNDLKSYIASIDFKEGFNYLMEHISTLLDSQT